MRVLVVDESAERGELLSAALRREGYDVAAGLCSPLALLATIERLRPDVIVIDVDSPSRDVLEHLVMVSENTPRPIVMFSADRAPDAIRNATRAGVSAYVVDGLDRTHIKAIVDAACARFEEFQALRERLRGKGQGASHATSRPRRRRCLRGAAQDGDGSRAETRRSRTTCHRRGGPFRCMT